MTTSNLLNDSGSAMRVAEIDRFVIRHSSFQKALNGIQDCIERSQHSREPVGCMLLAEGGMGKSSICKIIQTQYNQSEIVVAEGTITPVYTLVAEVPDPVSVSMLATNLLAAMNAANPHLGTIAGKTHRVATLLKQARTRIVFLDEFHNLLGVNAHGKPNASALNWLKSLVNLSGVCFCLSGTPGCEQIIDADTTFQINRRFRRRYHLAPLQPGTPETLGQLHIFLTQMCSHLREYFQFNRLPFIDRYDETLQMYAATHGNLAAVMDVLKETIYVALRRGKTELQIMDFAAQWDTLNLAGTAIVQKNPFGLQPTEIEPHIKKRYLR